MPAFSRSRRASPPTERYRPDVTEPLADAELTAFIGEFNGLQLPPAAQTGAMAMRAAAEGRAAARPKGPEMPGDG
jgi:hypothetical protein